MEAKTRLRKRIAEAVQAIDPDRRAREEARIHQRIRSLPAYREAESLLLYASTDDEVSTRPLLDDALAEGRQVCVPRVEGDSLDPILLESVDELEPGAYGVPEPSRGQPFDPRLLDLAVVPGVAFDPDGRRLGHGGGHFDRFLTDFHPLTVGICFECQLVPTVPTEDHDVPVDLVVHPWGIEGRAGP